MPRQPFSRMIPTPRNVTLQFGLRAVELREDLAELSVIVGRSLMMWPYVDSEMAIVLGILLKADQGGVLAVYQILRRSSNQREALSEAAKFTLDLKGQELLAAILGVHKSVEAERNALTHGHLGACQEIQDGLVWMEAAEFITFRVHLHLNAPYTDSVELNSTLASMAFVYKRTDLTAIYDAIRDLWKVWLEFGQYLQLKHVSAREKVYRQLCDRPRIAQELADIRRRNNPSTPPQ